MANPLEQLDAFIGELLSSWSFSTTLIALGLAAFIAYPLFYWDDADTHPLLLARQAAPSPVRNRGESATYRSLEAPHGYPLKSGLNVKDAAAPKWSAGRDGDVRDIWRAVVRGGAGGEKGLIMTVVGKDAPVEEHVGEMSKQINIIGHHLQTSAGKRVAIYLPNSVEYLSTVFACAFYGLSPILIPFNQPHHIVLKLLNDSKADCLVASAGSLPLVDICKRVSGVKQITWIVEKSSRHMDWNGAPDEAQGQVTVSVWHDLVSEDNGKTSAELPENDDAVLPGNLVTVWQAQHAGLAHFVEFTQRNIVSASAALISALPMRQRLGPSDLVLPADSFSSSYVLCQTFAALFSHASLAINSVAGPGVDLALAARSVSPTVIIASAETLSNLHQAATAANTSILNRFAHASQAKALTAGRMPTDTLLFKLLGPKGGAVATAPGKLRLIFVSERAATNTPPLSSSVMSDLRIFTRSRICYALTAAHVAGAVAQTNIFDYRQDGTRPHGHFGVPLSSVEIRLLNANDANVAGITPEGEIAVFGPAVTGGTTRLGIQGSFLSDCTLAYA